MTSSIALDLGTTSIKAGLLDRQGNLSHITSLPAPEIISQAGCFESNALEYAAAAEHALNECLAHTHAVLPLGLCSQRSSFLIWNKVDGQPVTPLISWQDQRGAASCDALRVHESTLQGLSGLRLTPYYFAPKLRTLLQDQPAWRVRLEEGKWAVGTLDTFLIWRLSGGQYHVTDASMAARTLLMDISHQQWSQELCALFGIPMKILPQIMPSTAIHLQLNERLTLQASIGDQSAALYASISGESGEALVNLGTGGFVIRYLDTSHPAPEGYLRTLVYQDQHLRSHIAVEGTLNSIAAALAPYPVNECRVTELGTTDIYCLAEPSGVGAPYFRTDLGLRFSRPVDHLSARQVACLLLEAIIFRVTRILEDFQHVSPLKRVYLSGGLSELSCLRQGIAICAPCAVYRLHQKESSLHGAALLAAGMPAGHHRNSEIIPPESGVKCLQDKYVHWKNWLDTLTLETAVDRFRT